MHWADRGAWTGEVSAGMLAETGARYVEVGHAERRRHFGRPTRSWPPRPGPPPRPA
ncbi:triose-phosphate isomerase [Streptomyces albulus]|nr:triose-phosphate isomerase [Streptomyces noursei]